MAARHASVRGAGAEATSRERRRLRAPSLDDALRPLDELVHERIRLGILSALAVSATLSFVDLRALLQTTDGTLSVHARRLEDAGYIECTKRFERRVPRTEFRITDTGRKAFEAYLDRMEELIRLTRKP